MVLKRSSLAGLRVLLAGGCVLLAGCRVGPDYLLPHVPQSQDYAQRSLLQQRKDPLPAPPLDAWWQGFADPQLIRIEQRVLGQNLDMAASLARVQQARAVAAYNQALRLPSGALEGQAVRQRQSLYSPEGELASAFPGYDRNQTLENLGAAASWETDLAGGLRRGQEAAEAEFQAAVASDLGVRVSVAAEAADAWFRYRGAQQRIAIAQEQIETEQRLLSIVNDRIQRGLGTLREQAEAQALVEQAQATVPPLRTESSLQLNRLDVLMGVAPGSSEKELASVVPDPMLLPIQTPALGDIAGPAQLMRRRPDVIAAERQLAASNARIGQALAQYYPDVSLSGLLGFESLASGQLFSSAAFQPQAVLGLHWRLFDFGRVDAEVVQARGANAQALAQYRLAMLRATEDVENAIVILVQLQRQRQHVDREVAAHQVARAAAEQAYDAGVAPLIEVLGEDRQLLVSRDQQAQLRAQDARSIVAAFRALGGGWQGSGEQSAGSTAVR